MDMTGLKNIPLQWATLSGAINSINQTCDDRNRRRGVVCKSAIVQSRLQFPCLYACAPYVFRVHLELEKQNKMLVPFVPSFPNKKVYRRRPPTKPCSFPALHDKMISAPVLNNMGLYMNDR